MENFRSQVINFVKKIPRGRVVSYGQVAGACGSPRAARQVGAILRSIDISSEAVPWWRVLNSRGVLSIKGNWTATKELQKKMLVNEGVQVGKDFILNINKYRWV